MTAIKTAFLNCIFVLVAVLVGPVTTYAGCHLQGSWISFNDAGAFWISTAHGQNAAHGTYILQVPGFDLTLGGFFSDAEKATDAIGLWERTSGNTFDFAHVFLVVNANRQTVWVGKLIGTYTLSTDCNTLTIDATVQVFLGTQNPFEEDPILSIQLPTETAYRMRVH